MQLTKKQKIAGTLLALALAAFATDRWVIGQGGDDAAVVASGAAAARPGPARRPVTRQSTPAAAAAVADGNVASLATRLENLRMSSAAKGQPLNLDSVRDAFRPPAGLVGSRRVETTDEQADAAGRFVERHKLAAVIKRQSGRGIAIIEDRTAAGGSLTLAVGQSLQGFTLVAVQDRVAIFRRGARRVDLRLQEDALPGAITTSEKVAGVDAAR